MRFGILTRNENAYSTAMLRRAFHSRGVDVFCFSFNEVVAHIKDQERFYCRGVDLLEELDGVLVRPIGRGSLEEVIFQVNLLHRLKRNGMIVVNDPKGIEVAVDKYYTVSILRAEGVPVPESVVTENVREGLRGFSRLGKKVVVKPLFGSRGIGISYFDDRDVLERVLRTLEFHRHVLYLQRFIPHGWSDLRVFVVGGEVIAAMRRVSTGWKNNISQGARPVATDIGEEVENLALRSARALGLEVAGVDVVEGPEGPLVIEVNSQPGWRGIQKVSKVEIAEKIADYLIAKAEKVKRRGPD
ncbi:MAG: RimK family alpha-L-glutamate ligase [Candidatus Bathyarchaeia archaeon]